MENYVLLRAGLILESAQKSLAVIPKLQDKAEKIDADLYRQTFGYMIASFFRSAPSDREAAARHRDAHFRDEPYAVAQMDLVRIRKLAALYPPDTEILLNARDARLIQLYREDS
jgi:hypothetical protein